MPYVYMYMYRPPYYKKYNEFCTDECWRKFKNGKLQCNCGEEYPVLDWHWKNDDSFNIKLTNDYKDVEFHPINSCGTAAVKGTDLFAQNIHHYWEVKMVSRVFGDDMMVGVATSNANYKSWKLRYGRMLGSDANSYGYSYLGEIQHNGMKRKYGVKYGTGSVIGVHLDMWNGTMEYFLNRKPLGIAFTGLKNMELYPMVCSSAAQTAVRVTCCVSQEPSLQIICLKTIMNNPQLHKQYRQISGLTKIYDREYFWIRPHDKEHDEKQKLAELDEEFIFPLRKRRQNRQSGLSRRPVVCTDSEDNTSSDEEAPPRKSLKDVGVMVPNDFYQGDLLDIIYSEDDMGISAENASLLF